MNLYENPEIEVISISAEDIMMASDPWGEPDELPIIPN